MSNILECAFSPSSQLALSTDTSSGAWDRTGACNSQDEDGDGDGDDMGEQLQKDLLWAPRKVWVSDEERFRVNFKRIKNTAEKMGLDKSPFFPKTAAELAGLRAETLEAAARKLRAKIDEKEKEKEKGEWGQQNAHWAAESTVGLWGPECHSAGADEEAAHTAYVNPLQPGPP